MYSAEKCLEVAVLDLSLLITVTTLLSHAHSSRKVFSPIVSPISPASFLWWSLSHEICVLLWIMHQQSFQINICWINKWIGYFLITFFLNFFFLRFIRLGFPDTLERVTLCDDLERLPIWQDLESSRESRRCTVRKSACSATTKNWVWIHRTRVKELNWDSKLATPWLCEGSGRRIAWACSRLNETP